MKSDFPSGEQPASLFTAVRRIQAFLSVFSPGFLTTKDPFHDPNSLRCHNTTEMGIVGIHVHKPTSTVTYESKITLNKRSGYILLLLFLDFR